ncbi:uncharacterized protein PgNI_00362 [Pyricularia grisea]|uniref:Pre-mRNA-splicing factor 38 n=1 Tax=Pyricularia grisea TaxID=148305 RepID=A0A6P8BFS2_PYRGI|nr:uncharacterized protein PgNI_00362 [Pyricularia grisea]TLD15565.1 hypothetical protein PgNI_00362 [Pyricularia grisea]
MGKIHQASEHKFLDERGSSSATLAPNGLNRARIMEKAVVDRITESYFWKEQCFGVNEADIVDRVVDHVTYIGGVVGQSQKPTPFLCLAFKLLQLGPDDSILAEYLNFGGEKFKYLRALAIFYVRLTRTSAHVFRTLEPFLEDRRKLRRKGRAGTSLTYMDEFADDLLTKDRVCATSLYKLTRRDVLEDLDELEPRVSPLGDLEDLLEEEEEEEKQRDAEENRDKRDRAGSRDRSSDDEGRITDDDDDAREGRRSRDRDEVMADRDGSPGPSAG